MVSGDDFQGLVLKGVIKLYELGCRTYGIVYAVKYCGTKCCQEVYFVLMSNAIRVSSV